MASCGDDDRREIDEGNEREGGIGGEKRGGGVDGRMEKIKQRDEIAEALLRKAQHLSTKGMLKGVQRLERKIKAERAFLQSILTGRTPLCDNHLCSSNLLHFEAVLHITEHATAVTAIEQSFTLIPAVEHTPVSLPVDVVADGGCTWVRVFTRNRKALHRKWLGDGQFGSRSVSDLARDYVQASSQNLCKFQPPRVTFAFFDGITESVAKDLLSSGVLLLGPVYSDESSEVTPSPLEVVTMFREVEHPAPSLPSPPLPPPPPFKLPSLSEPICDQVNLDVSTLLAWVSSLTNGGTDYIFHDAVIAEQALQERRSPLRPQLEQATRGKRLMACRTAVNDFNSIVDTVGGTEERKRRSALLHKVEVVADCPSERAMALKCSSRIKHRAKVVFGCGDSLCATTLTANSGFVRAAMHQGVHFDCYIHSSRALSEAKESPLDSHLTLAAKEEKQEENIKEGTCGGRQGGGEGDETEEEEEEVGEV